MPHTALETARFAQSVPKKSTQQSRILRLTKSSDTTAQILESACRLRCLMEHLDDREFLWLFVKDLKTFLSELGACELQCRSSDQQPGMIKTVKSQAPMRQYVLHCINCYTLTISNAPSVSSVKVFNSNSSKAIRTCEVVVPMLYDLHFINLSIAIVKYLTSE